MPRRWKLTAITISVVTSSLTLLTACGGLPASAGVLSSLGGLLLVLLIAAFATGQSGCRDSEPCLSFLIDTGPRDSGVDAGSPDADVQDAAEDDAGIMDVCLSDVSMVPPRPAGSYGVPRLDYAVSLDRDRRAVIERLEREGVLDSDIARDLVSESDDREA